MAKLRLKLVLNEGGEGIPLSQLASISEEAEKFIRYLAADAGMRVSTSDLIARKFENRSVRFSIEDDGDHQINELKGFNSRLAFVAEFKRSARNNGFVRHQTMLQYTKVADALSGHEKLSFGVFHPSEDQPYEYRPLTKESASAMKSALTEEAVYVGTIQGKIHTICVAESWFHFRYAKSEKLVRCTYPEAIYPDLMRAASHRKALVYIRGEISSRRFDKEIQHVKVRDVKAAPRLSSERYEAFFGADPDYTGGMSTNEFIDSTREYEH